MRSLIVTVAGTATRFNRDTAQETLKCLYYIDEPSYCLLAQILHKCNDYDEFIIVGGYLYDKLAAFIDLYLTDYKSRIKLVYNEHYRDYGSGYSLMLGINNLSECCKEVLFAEGDLYFSESEIMTVKECQSNVITVNHELITAKKAVVVYTDQQERLHYLYDTSHNMLEIPEPFLSVYNSAQIWKFTDVKRLRDISDGLTDKQIKGTNLEIVQAYFGSLGIHEYSIIPLSIWYNCNTVSDYNQIYSRIKK